MNRYALLVVLQLLLFGPGPAIGSSESDSQVEFSLEECKELVLGAIVPAKKPGAVAERDAQETRHSPGGVGGLAPKLQTSVDLVAGEENGRGVLTYSGKAEGSGGLSSKWAVSANVPFDKTKGEGIFLSLTGLSGDIVFSAEKSWFRWNPLDAAYADNLCNTCEKEGVSMLECSPDLLEKRWSQSQDPLPEPDLDKIEKEVQRRADELQGALSATCDEQMDPLLDCSIKGLKALWTKQLLAEERKKIEDSRPVDEELAKQAAARVEKLNLSFFGDVAGKFWGFEGSVGRKDRSYFKLDGDKESEDRAGFSASLVRGWVRESSTIYARLIGKRDYKENDKATKCTGIEDSTLESCQDLPLGEAKETDSLVAALEWRRFYKDMAIAPSAAFDFETDKWAAQLPVFLIQNKDDAFTGGVKFLWDSETNDFAAAVFVSRALTP